jgi:hypothetical protein
MACASLIIAGKSLDVGLVTRLMRLKPSQTWQVCDQKKSRGRSRPPRVIESALKWNGWRRWPNDKERKSGLNSQIENWLTILTKRSGQLAKIRAAGGMLIIDCTVIAEDDFASLSYATIVQMATLGIHFEITFYSGSK